jgi:hypothetical protein
LHAQLTNQEKEKPMKQDIYQKVTDKIIADLEQGELTWLKPWSAGNTDGRIVKPLRHNGMAYSGIVSQARFHVVVCGHMVHDLIVAIIDNLRFRGPKLRFRRDIHQPAQYTRTDEKCLDIHRLSRLIFLKNDRSATSVSPSVA